MEDLARETFLGHPCRLHASERGEVYSPIAGSQPVLSASGSPVSLARAAALPPASDLYPDTAASADDARPQQQTQPKGENDVSLSVLITQCIQNDFVSLLNPADPLPNRLHIGHSEAERIVGRNPESGVGPLSQIMQWARAQPKEELLILHIRDFHDPTDKEQAQHLAKFGPHCLANTEGAKLVLSLEDNMQDNEKFVNCSTGIGLNDCKDTNLPQLLEEAKKRVRGSGKLRIGVIGVWTEVKVSYLLYDLKTVFGIDELATCSALTAGGSRSMHFYALNLMQTSLDVKVFDSVGDFAQWLSPSESPLDALPSPAGTDGLSCPLHIDFEDSSTTMASFSEEDHAILCYLFRNHSRLQMYKLAGGYSGAGVFRVKGVDAAGNRRPLSILKLGPRKLIARERVNFERVQDIMGNHAPSILGFADFKERSGIKFAYAAMTQRGEVATFRSLYNSGAPLKRIDRVLVDLFEEVLGPMYAGHQFERLCLLDYYDFNGKGWSWAVGGTDTPSKVKERVADIMGVADGSIENILFPGGQVYRNVATFLEHDLPTIPRRATEQNLVAFQHGDLNGGNILIDDNRNVWVIDFADTGRGHILKDIAKLEAEVTWAWTHIENDQELAEALLITQVLTNIKDLSEPLPEHIEGLVSTHIIRAYETVRILRQLAGTIVKTYRNPLQMSIVQLRYALHTLCYPHIPRYQKMWALASACGYAQHLLSKTQRIEGPLLVRYVPMDNAPHITGKLGITIIPGRGWRDLDLDVQRLQELKTARLVCLCSEDELYDAASIKLRDALAQRSIQYYHFPVFPGAPPPLEKAKDIVAWIGDGLAKGHNVVLVSRAGLGRCGVLSACCLMELCGMTPDAAIDCVRKARGNHRAISSEKHLAFIQLWRRRCVPGHVADNGSGIGRVNATIEGARGASGGSPTQPKNSTPLTSAAL
eukprot:TRINITY_DN6185_c0_g1_i1.p1 TRINITY_DN6185_c0_g1~~TRINITY_DN6185_c0_g1_i1.p1  ORF type:complete len:939 (-),score=88.84 TRINITY_DN6185_c0_g1_i1:55-2847(-)